MPNVPRVLGGVLIAAAAYWITRRSSAAASGASSSNLEQVAGIPFAGGSASPVWPVLSSGPDRFSIGYVEKNGTKFGNQSRRFGASRDGRRHAGIDIYASAGDVVVAAEAGTVGMVRNTFNLGTGILFLWTKTGITLAYGEVDPGSWSEFGVATGTKVDRGQKLARVGCMKFDADGCSSHMLHFEIYRGQQTRNESWYPSKGVPPNLLNPTAYLVRARAGRS